MPDVSRLPKWAQEHIASLQREVNRLKGRQTAWEDADPWPGSDVRWTNGYEDLSANLPSNCRVVWGEGSRGERIQVYRDLNGKICISGDRSIEIHPVASNSLYVSVRKD